MLLGVEQTVATFAIGVIGNNVKRTHRSQAVVQFRTIFVDAEIVLVQHCVDKVLHRPFTKLAIAQYGWRNDVECHCFGKFVGSHFAFVQARLEIPQWAFAF